MENDCLGDIYISDFLKGLVSKDDIKKILGMHKKVVQKELNNRAKNPNSLNNKGFLSICILEHVKYFVFTKSDCSETTIADSTDIWGDDCVHC